MRRSPGTRRARARARNVGRMHLGVRVRGKRVVRRPVEYARGHRERFIFSGLSNRRGRYVHALAAINDLISVSFHLQDYGGAARAKGSVSGGREREGKRERER